MAFESTAKIQLVSCCCGGLAAESLRRVPAARAGAPAPNSARERKAAADNLPPPALLLPRQPRALSLCFFCRCCVGLQVDGPTEASKTIIFNDEDHTLGNALRFMMMRE